MDLQARGLRIGDVLVRMGVITYTQRDEILVEQQLQGRPFGQLAEHLFAVEPELVERAWAEQYAELVGTIDLADREPDPEVLDLVTPRQAWQFAVLPMHREEHHGRCELILCSTRRDLPRALRFTTTMLDEPTMLLVTDPVGLGEALTRYYPMAGMDADQFASGFATLVPRSA